MNERRKWDDIYQIIKDAHKNHKDWINSDLKNLFKEYENKNLALVLIKATNSDVDKIFLRTRVLNKKIDKTINLKKNFKNSGAMIGVGTAIGAAVFAATGEATWIAVGVAIGAALSWRKP